jgi:glycosyltransferase involved in cell wall biosynthesis
VSGLRFAMVTTFYPPNHFGGDAIFIRRLAQALARRGHEVDVIHDVDAFELLHRGPHPAPINDGPRIRTHPLRSRIGPLSCLLTQQLGRPVVHGERIRSILEGGKFDVVHFHNISLVGGPKVLGYGDGIKLLMAHEHWLVCPMHVLWRHGRELCDKRECTRCALHYKRPPQLWRHGGLLERELAHVDALISPSAFSAAKHREFGFPRDFDVVPYFLPDLDSDSETPSADAPLWERPYFLFVGRLEKIKGLQDVFHHFGADAPADLLVVGTGDYEATLRAQAAAYPRVYFLGRRPLEDIRPLYRDAIATLVPSLCFETFGIVALESFREATPVIGRALGPLPEIVNSSGGGILFSNDDELRNAMSTLAGDAAMRERMGDAALRALRDNWVESVVLDQYFGLISRAARRRGIQRVQDALGPLAGDGPAGSQSNASDSQPEEVS